MYLNRCVLVLRRLAPLSDLKLDNILLTLDGHVKVADYGLCKEDMWFGSTTSTFCGTPEFMAPEVSFFFRFAPEKTPTSLQILLEQRYGRAVDWWAFGVLMYEMLLGQSPFRGDDEDEIFDAILEDEPLYPITMPRDAVSILQKVSERSIADMPFFLLNSPQLLTRDPARRLGAGKADAEEIKRHPFFKDVSFDDVLNKRIPPPYFPTIVSEYILPWRYLSDVPAERKCGHEQLRRRVHPRAADTHAGARSALQSRPGRVHRLLLGMYYYFGLCCSNVSPYRSHRGPTYEIARIRSRLHPRMMIIMTYHVACLCSVCVSWIPVIS